MARGGNTNKVLAAMGLSAIVMSGCAADEQTEPKDVCKDVSGVQELQDVQKARPDVYMRPDGSCTMIAYPAVTDAPVPLGEPVVIAGQKRYKTENPDGSVDYKNQQGEVTDSLAPPMEGNQ